MFETMLTKYKLDTKDYALESGLIKKDIDYLIAHNYRTRLSTEFDLIIIPSKSGVRKNIIKDMFFNATLNWWDNTDKYLPAIDLVDAIMNDLKTLSTGKLETIVNDALLFQTELNTITTVNLKKYIKDFIANTTTSESIKVVWEKQEKGVV